MISDNDDGHKPQGITLKLPEKLPPKPIEPILCARLYGFGVRDCACMKRVGGFLECPPEAHGLLEDIETFRQRCRDANPELFPLAPIAAVNKLAGNSGFARSALTTIRQATIGPGIARHDPTDVERPPETREQIAAAVDAERELIGVLRQHPPTPVINTPTVSPQPIAAAVTSAPRGGRGMGFTGSICGHCGSARMIRNGVCETCLDCYTSGECG